MHEWGLIRALVRELTCAAAAHGGGKIIAAKVIILSPAGVSSPRLRRQFEIAAVGSPAEGAALQIEVAPKVFESRVDEVYVESIEIEA